MKRFFLLLALMLSGLLLNFGCRQQEKAPQQEAAPPATTAVALKAVANMQPTQNSNVTGVVTFTEVDDGVRVQANLQGLVQQRYGFHIHEFGDCSAPDASSAGGHFNPDGSQHGGPDAPAGKRHVGDLGNIEAGTDGTGSYDRVDRIVQLRGAQSIIGKSIVLHAHEDDLQTDPTGESGDRLACGVIEQSANP